MAQQPPAAQRALSGTLLVQCNTHKRAAYEDMIGHADRPGAGLVLTGRRALTAANHVVNTMGYGGPVLVDAARYAQDNRVLASAPFTEHFIQRQRELGLPWVMPDAGYIAEDDPDGLVSILSRVHDRGDGTAALLAMSWQWLDPKGRRRWLIDQITQAGVPIAVALEHKDDPLKVQYAVEGLAELLAAPVDVMVLRCDVSAVGALCFGAVAAALGTTSTLRHIPAGGGGGPGHDASAILPPCLAYKRLNHILKAIASDPDNPIWECPCHTCYRRPISVLANTADPEAACAEHSVDLLCELRDELLDNELSDVERRQSWARQCDHAAARCAELASVFPIEGRATPPALRHWAAMGGGEVKKPAAR
jgi:hypothetical protein